MQPEQVLQPARSAVSWRSVTLGLLSTIAICSIAYYNDFALGNTLFTGNNLPLCLVLMTFLFILLVNGPLSRWFPGHAFSSGELVVSFSMALVACTLPSSGLMRWLPHALVSPLWHAQANKEYRDLLLSLHLPEWLFPTFSSSNRRTWFNDPIVNGFMGRWAGNSPPPYAAWIRPAIAWAVPTFATYGAVMCLMTILRRQWVENERLPFPIAQIQLSLLEAPPHGAFFNTLLRNRLFWIGFGIVCFIHLWNGSAAYAPRYFPRIPVEYNFNDIFANPPWSYVAWGMKTSTLFFTVAGVAYFLPSTISFSIWGTFIGLQIYMMMQGELSGDSTIPGMSDQRFGGVLAFLLAVLWIGRHHWRLVIAQSFRGERPGEPTGRYLSYPAAFWGLVASIAILVGWLMLAGCNFPGSVLLVVTLLTLFLITARIVAETGLVHSPALAQLYRPLVFLRMADVPHPPVETFYMTSIFEQSHYGMRETLAVYGSHSLRLADQTIFGADNQRAARSTGRKFLLVLALALLVGYVVSWAGTLGTEYNYAATLDRRQVSPLNPRAVANGLWDGLSATLAYSHNLYNVRHNPASNFALGFGLTGFLAFMRLHYVWWPVHPIGYLILGTFPGNLLWFSFFIGWVAKQLIVKFGGHQMYVRARPFFMGIIVGESVAAGAWMVLSIILSSLGYSYVTVRVMPA